MRSCATIANRSFRHWPAIQPTKRPQAPGPQRVSFASISSRKSRSMVAVEAISPVHVAVGVVGLAALAAWVDALMKSKKPELVYAASAFNKAVLSRCPTLHSVYRCTPFLTNGHVETIMVAKLRRAPGVDYRREIILTKDGGAVAIDWEHVDDQGKDLPSDAPVLILFPGLTGGSGDSYVQHAVMQARHAGIRAAVFNSRGTADSPVITPQFYSASFTDDTREVIAHVSKRYPNSTLFAAGWSLGANILVNYLGEQGTDTPLEAAVSMCNPFDLTISNRHINEGFNQIYNWNLAASLKRIFAKHHLVWKGHPGPAQPHAVPTVKTIREFDEAITIHSFDWEDVDAYYAGSSSAKRIPKVAIPLLCIQALDDPIAPAEAIPCDDIQANPNCVLAVTPCGGHLGWAAGPGAPFNHPWTDQAVFEWLNSVHFELMKRKSQGNGSSTSTSANSSSSSSVPVLVDARANGNGVASAAMQQSAAVEKCAVFSVDVTADSTAGSCSVPMSPSSSSYASAAGASSSSQASSADSPASVSSRSPQQQQQHSSQEAVQVAAAPFLSIDQLWWGQKSAGQTTEVQQQGVGQAQQEAHAATSPAFPAVETAISVHETASKQQGEQQEDGQVQNQQHQQHACSAEVHGLQPQVSGRAVSEQPQAAGVQQQIEGGTAQDGVNVVDDVLSRAHIATAELRWAF